MEDFYALRVKAIWKHFKSEHFSFWMICAYLFVEYVRPQSILPWLDFLPWAKVFVLGALVGWLADRNKKWVSSPINKWMVLFFLCILLSSWQAYRPDISYKHLADFYTWMIIYFLIINIVNTEKRFFIFIFIFLVASFKLSFSLALTWASRGFAFTSWGLMGPPGFFQNSGELAIQMAVFWPIALAVTVALKRDVTTWKYLTLVAMPITAGMVILGASSRGGQLALAVQLIFKYYKKLFNIKIIIIIVTVIFLAWWLLPQEQKNRFTQAGEDRTSQQRLLYWENGLEMMNEHPWLGVGYFNFSSYFERYYHEDMLYQHAELPHNIFIQVGTDAGYLGVILYVLIIIKGFSASRNAMLVGSRNNHGALMVGVAGSLNISLVGFMVAGQFVSVVYYPFLWIHVALAVVVNNVTNVTSHRGSEKSRHLYIGGG